MPFAAAGAVAGVASAAAGIASAASGGSSSGTANTSATSAPWSAQQPYLQDGFKNAQTIFNQRNTYGVPQQYVAQQNDMQGNAIGAQYNAGMAAPGQFAPWTAAGTTLAGNAQPYSQNALALANRGIGSQSANSQTLGNYAQTGYLPNQISTFNNGLSGTLNNAANQGAGSLGQGAALASRVGSQALDPNGTINAATSAGSSYANSAPLQAQIDAANADVERGLGQNSLTGIRQAAMGSGNANSSREGALESSAINDARRTMASNSATIRSNAYNTGANIGAAGYQNGLNTALNSANSLNSNGNAATSLGTTLLGQQQQNDQFGTSSRIGALGTAGTQDLGYQTANTSAQLAGNNQLGQGLSYGAQASQLGLNGTLTGLQAAYQAGSAQQQGQQDAINQNLDLWNAQDQRTQKLLNDYWGVVNGQYGSDSTKTSTTTPSLGGQLAQGIGALKEGIGAAQNAYNSWGSSATPDWGGAGAGFGGGASPTW